jgi:hypothetical protein
MKKFIAALSLAVASFASYASVITEYQAAATFPTTQNDLGAFTVSGNSNGSSRTGVNLLYTFDANTSYVGFNFTASQFSTLFVKVTAADSSTVDFSRTITGNQMFWGFSAADSHISTVNFFTTSASSSNGNVANDNLNIGGVVGYVQPTAPAPTEEIPVPSAAVPEPGTVALLGLGLLGFAASRRKSAKSKNA